ncbi:MAG: type II toxin-antitoxin system death-on-curing family toxin [Deltaproteobacteria bacterium]|nr:type II toxin-antitoxin system death-on-curing family toxin [Deltaproteobacteria bacterium]
MCSLTPEQVLFIHYRLIEETGGRHGVRDLKLLLSALARPDATFDGSDLYGDIFTKAAALMHGMIKNHPFVDGNKRTAITASSLFLLRKGYKLETSNDELHSFTLKVASENISIEEITRWFRS